MTAKNHDDLIDRVAPSSDFDNVLLLFEVQLKIVKQVFNFYNIYLLSIQIMTAFFNHSPLPFSSSIIIIKKRIF